MFWNIVTMHYWYGICFFLRSHSESGSGSRRAKITLKIRKKVQKFMFRSTGCSLLRAEGFSCRLDVLYWGLRISKLQFWIVNFWSWNPGSGSGLVFSVKCWIRIRVRNQWIRIRNTAKIRVPVPRRTWDNLSGSIQLMFENGFLSSVQVTGSGSVLSGPCSWWTGWRAVISPPGVFPSWTSTWPSSHSRAIKRFVKFEID